MAIEVVNKIQSYLPKEIRLLNETIRNAAIADTRTIIAWEAENACGEIHFVKLNEFCHRFDLFHIIISRALARARASACVSVRAWECVCDI